MSTATLKEIAEHARSWSEAEQRELAEYARSIEARRNGVYVAASDERAAILEGLGQVRRGEFATVEDLTRARTRYQK